MVLAEGVELGLGAWGIGTLGKIHGSCGIQIHELYSKLLASPLITFIILPYRNIYPVKEFRL